MAAGESILYYHPDEAAKPAKLTGVLFRMKVRIRRVKPEEVLETVGHLAGLKGFEAGEGKAGADGADEKAVIREEMMVLSNFSNARLNELLAQLRKAGAPKIALKAMITPTNCRWSFYDLYKEIREEHDTLNQPRAEAEPTGGAAEGGGQDDEVK